MTQNERYAYLGGYFNGEGSICFDVAGHKAPVLAVSVQSADTQTLELFAETFGGTVRPVKRRQVRRQLFHWARSGVAAQVVLTALIPFLIEKRHIAKLALQCDYSRPTFHVSEEEIAKRFAIVAEVSAFNNRVTAIN